jgi:tetratricopeptide (TPR) repeat protein
MKRLLGRGLTLGLAAVATALLFGCAQPPLAPVPASLLHDELFPPPAVRPDPAEVFALSPEMLRFAQTALPAQGPFRDRRRELVDALYKPGTLRLSYDSDVTRTARQAFDERAGNCLSLVIMTAAFAKHLGLPVYFQSVVVDEEYTRNGDITFAAGHINVAIGRPGPQDPQSANLLTVDFLPQDRLRDQRTRPLDEHTVVAMFMNNRAAESLASGLIGQSYWWAREALRADPAFLPAANTLGVIYTRAGRLAEAEAALRHLLERDRENVNALTNLARLLRREGRAAEAAELDKRLAEVQPYPPFFFSDKARGALERGQFAEARDLLRRELRRQPYQHEVHFLLALAYAGLGQVPAATRHMTQAMENSPTRNQQSLYGAKLVTLKALRVQ